MPFASLLLAADSANTVPLTAALDNPVGQMYPMIATVVVFLIVFGILATVVWPKILGGLEDRQQKIQGDIEQAEQSRAEAEQAKADFEAKLTEARKAAAAPITQLRTMAMADIESAKSAAVAEIHAEAGALATAVASKILGREITVADQQQLVQESLAEMKG